MKFGPIQYAVQKDLDRADPKMYRIRQQFSSAHSLNPGQDVYRSMSALCWPDLRGKRIGITAGSRRIANLPTILASIGRFLRERGGSPFVIPAMGSHGGGTAEGQTALLANLGITEETVGMPIVSSMETRIIGTLDDGLPIYCSTTALEADGIVVCGRIKPHTSIRGKVESGLFKMMVVGLGKHRGAAAFHQRGYPALADTLLKAGLLFLDKLPVLCGVGIVENAFDDTLLLEAIPAHRILERESQLLEMARENMPRFLLDDIDVLVVDRIGKDISGAGMDPNITGRSITPLPIETKVPVRLITVLGITPASHGNATGIGGADLTTTDVVEHIDWTAMYTNAFTSGALSASKIPVVVNNDREAIRMAICCTPRPDVSDVKVVHIQDTLHMTEIRVSENYLPSIVGCPAIEVLDQGHPFAFDDRGKLVYTW